MSSYIYRRSFPEYNPAAGLSTVIFRICYCTTSTKLVKDLALCFKIPAALLFDGFIIAV
ncbi:hypothetical protein CLOSTHATH_03511 [Hungatella hathewayi DSM 13479]|uniref:Uncharacterized protein n=1 Tax=Hungatella hathewayi DSM 13479 TaxID=566550 RepID=D3AIS2_9FIRM|nr:hypothetical protein CLOSTHATH_03511 [Hungatella hathewayi DSM 13479]